jgi:DNA-binding MarR family transcriptional regulator
MTLSARNWAWDAETIAEQGVQRALLPGEKLTLLCLAEHENAEHGYAYPSQETIAKRTKLGERTVRRHLDAFVAAGAISRRKQRRGAGTWANTVYVLNVPDRYRTTDPEWNRWH